MPQRMGEIQATNNKRRYVLRDIIALKIEKNDLQVQKQLDKAITNKIRSKEDFRIQNITVRNLMEN